MRAFLASFASLAVIAATVPAMAADMIGSYERPPMVKHGSRPLIRAHYIEHRHLDCSDMIVEYRDISRSEVVTVCHRVR